MSVPRKWPELNNPTPGASGSYSVGSGSGRKLPVTTKNITIDTQAALIFVGKLNVDHNLRIATLPSARVDKAKDNVDDAIEQHVAHSD